MKIIILINQRSDFYGLTLNNSISKIKSLFAGIKPPTSLDPYAVLLGHVTVTF